MSVQTERSTTVELPTGRSVTVQKQRTRTNYHARVRISLDCEWVFGVDKNRNAELLVSYDERGNLATISVPEWIPLVLAEIGLTEVES